MFKTALVTMIPFRSLCSPREMNDLSRDYSMGSMPLDNTVRDAKLMFGLLAGKEGEGDSA